MNRKYNTLFLDLDDTLLDYSGDENAVIIKVLEKHRLPHTPDVIELFRDINIWQDYELGKEITPWFIITYRFQKLLTLFNAANKAEEISKEFYELMIKSHRIKPGALKTVKYLKERGYKLYITANGYNELQYVRFKNSKIANFFDGVFLSENVGSKKPSRAFFDYVFNHIPESNRSKILIIGDSPQNDIMGGINAKIDTCFLSNNGEKSKYRYTYKIEKITDLIEIL